MRPLVLFGGVAIAAVAIAKGFGNADRAFLQEAARDGLAELDAARLALAQAAGDPVRQFAQRMIDDHGRLQAELAVVAAAQGVKLPERTSIADQAALKLLAGRSGETFDREYAESAGVQAHEKSVKRFEHAAADARSGDVRAFAQRSLAALREHLAAAQALLLEEEAKAEAPI